MEESKTKKIYDLSNSDFHIRLIFSLQSVHFIKVQMTQNGGDKGEEHQEISIHPFSTAYPPYLGLLGASASSGDGRVTLDMPPVHCEADI